MATLITSLVNGHFSDRLDLNDRGLAYGHGLFETAALVDGCALHWAAHLSRLRHGARRLAIPFDDALAAQLDDDLKQLLASLDVIPQRLVLKLMLTRGQGGRGYAAPADMAVNRILLLSEFPIYADHPAQNGICIHVCQTMLGRNPLLAGIKHLNRLEQVLARAEWSDPHIREGLVCDTEGMLVEGTMSNLFWITDGLLYTPDLSFCGVAGIMRERVMQLAGQQGIRVQQGFYSLETLQQCDELFVTNSLIGIWPVVRCDEARLSRQWRIGPITQQLQQQLAAEGVR